MLACHLGSITAASARLLSFRLPNCGDIVPSGVFGVCPPFSITTDSARLRLSITADSIRLRLFRLPNRGDIVILVAFVLY